MLKATKQWAGVLLLCALSSTTWAAAQQGQRFGDWGVQCEAAPDNTQLCYVQQVLSEKGKKVPLMVTVLGYGQGKQFPTAIFELPKGIDIKKGVQLKVDNNPPVGFSGVCNGQGCRAGFTLDNKMFQQLTHGKRALLAYRPAPNKEPLIFPVSLNGLAAGLNAVK